MASNSAQEPALLDPPTETAQEQETQGPPDTVAVDTNNNSVLIDAINTKLNDLKLNVKCLNSRCDQFNDVKQSIRQMNDLIKEDLFMDFGSIALLLRTRLDEMCDKIKERLKDAYSVVRDTQAKLVSKLGELKQELEELEKLKEQCQSSDRDQSEAAAAAADETAEASLKKTVEQIEQKVKFARDQIDLINNELYFLICGGSGVGDDRSSTLQSATNQILALRGSNSDSLLVENHLYPQFNYYIDTSRLVSEINNLYVQLGPSNNVNPKVYFFDDPLNENYLNARVASASPASAAAEDDGQSSTGAKEETTPAEPKNCIIRNNTFDCVVNSSLNADGSFWIQLIGSSAPDVDVPEVNRIKRKQQKLNLFIEELNKYVRQKRIGDKQWHTYAEALELGLHAPAINEKCFCLEPRSRKWLRARLLKFDLTKQTCHVRFMDTGHSVLDDSIPFSHLLLWKDFDLSKMPARVIKCVLLVEEGSTDEAAKSHEKDICLETRFLFRDLTAKKFLKCFVLEPVPKDQSEETSDDEDTWYVRLHYSKEKTVNHLIHEINENEKKIIAGKEDPANLNFRSLDIRMENGGGEGMQVSTKIIKMNVSSMPTVATPADDAAAAAQEADEQTVEPSSLVVVHDEKPTESEASLPANLFEAATEDSQSLQQLAVDTTTVDIEKPSLVESQSTTTSLNEQGPSVEHNYDMFTNVTHHNQQDKTTHMHSDAGQASSFATNRFNQRSASGNQQQRSSNCRNRNRQTAAPQYMDHRDTNFSLPPQRHQESFDQQQHRQQQQTTSLLGDFSQNQPQFGNQLQSWPDQSARFHSSQPNVSNASGKGGSRQPFDSERSKQGGRGGKGSQSRRRSPPKRRDDSPNQHSSFSHQGSMRSTNPAPTNAAAAADQQQAQNVEQPSPTVSGHFNTWQGNSLGGKMKADDPNEMRAGSRSLALGSPNNRNDRNRSNRRLQTNTAPGTTPDGSVDGRNRTKPRNGPGVGACKNEGKHQGWNRRGDNGDDDDDHHQGDQRRGNNFGQGRPNSGYRGSGGGGSGSRNDYYNNKYGHKNGQSTNQRNVNTMLDDFENHKRSYSSASTSLSSLLAINQFHLNKKTKPPRKETLIKQATSKLMSGAAGPYVVMCADEEQSSSAFNDVFIDSDSMFNLNANLGRSSRTESDCDDDDGSSEDDDEDDDRFDPFRDPGGGLRQVAVRDDYYEDQDADNECDCDECRCPNVSEQREYTVSRTRIRARSCCEEFLFVRQDASSSSARRRRGSGPWQDEAVRPAPPPTGGVEEIERSSVMTNNTTSSSAVPKPRRKRNRDKSYSNDYFCLYYTQERDRNREDEQDELEAKKPSDAYSSNRVSRSIEKSRNRYEEDGVLKSCDLSAEQVEKESSKQEQQKISGLPLNDEENQCLDKLKSLQSTQSELSLDDKGKLGDEEEELDCPIGQNKSLDEWDDLYPGANSYARMRHDCCTTRSTTTTEQILSNLAKVELEEGAGREDRGDDGTSQHSLELKKKMCEENTTSMDTTSDLMQLEMTLDITHPVACRHASQLPLDGQPQSPAITTRDDQHLSRFQHQGRHRPPGSLFTLHSVVKPRSFSANAAVSANVNSWSVDLRRADEQAQLRFGRLELHQKQLIADEEPEPRTEPAIASVERNEHGGEEDESFESCAEEMIFLRSSTTASSCHTSGGDDEDCEMKPKASKKSRIAADDDTDVSHDEHFSHQDAVEAVKADQSPNSTRQEDGEDAFKNSFKSNKTHETSSLNTIDPILVDDEDPGLIKPKPADNRWPPLSANDSFQDVREDDRLTLTAKLSQSSLQGADDPEPKEQAEAKSAVNSKVERLKKFTMAVFVDSFEDYSLNKTSSCSSSSSSSTPNTTTNADTKALASNAAPNKDDTAPSNAFGPDFLNSSASQANNANNTSLGPNVVATGSSSIASSTLNSSLILVNTSTSLTQQVNNNLSVIRHNESTLAEGFVTAVAAPESLSSTARDQNVSDNLNSLREFELNEAKIKALGSDYGLSSQHSESSRFNRGQTTTSSKLRDLNTNLMLDEDDVFMFQSNPNLFSSSTPNKNASKDEQARPVTSKPPALISNVVYSGSTAGTPSRGAHASPSQLNHHSYYFNNDDSADRQTSTAATTINPANYGYLSTITEYSNETYETCSNQSSNVNLKNRPQSHSGLHPRHSASSNSTATSLTNHNATVISLHAPATAVLTTSELIPLRSQHSDDMKASVDSSAATTVKKLTNEEQDALDHLDDSKVTLRRKGGRSAVKDSLDSSMSRPADEQYDGAPTQEYQQLVNRKVNSWLRVCGNEETRERQLQQLTKSDINVYDITVDQDGQLDQLLTSSASVTDKLFEKFCLIANDEIMNDADYSVTSSSMLIASNPPRPLAATLQAVNEDLANQSSSSSASFKTSLSQIKDDPVKVIDYKTYLKNQSSTTTKFSSLIGSDDSSSSSDSSSTISSSITLSSLNNLSPESKAKQPARDQTEPTALKPNRRVVLPAHQNIYLESSIPVDAEAGLFSTLDEDNDEVFLKQEDKDSAKNPPSDKRSATAAEKNQTAKATGADLGDEGSSTSISLSIEASKSESDLMALDFTPASRTTHEPHRQHHHHHHLKSNDQVTSSPSPLDASCHGDESCYCFNANCAAILNSTLSGGHNLSPHQSRHKHSGHHHRHGHHHRAHRSLSRGANSLLGNAYYNQVVSSSLAAAAVAAANNAGSVTPVQTPGLQQNSSSPFTPGGPNASHNLSTATTIEISSYTSDSLFNSHFIITPMCSEAGISPSTVTQLGSILLAKSPLLPPMSPSLSALSPSINVHATSPLASSSLSLNLPKQQPATHASRTLTTGQAEAARPQGGISANNMNLIAQLTASISGLAARSLSSTSSSNTGVTAVPAGGLQSLTSVTRPVSPPPPPPEPASQSNGNESLSLSLPPPPPPIPPFLDSDSNEKDSRREFQVVLRSFKNRSTSSPPNSRESNPSASANSSTARAVRTPPSAVIAKIIESLSLQAHNGGPISNLFSQQHRSHSAAPSVKPSSRVEAVEKPDNGNSSILSLPPPPSPNSLEAATGLNAMPDMADEGQKSTSEPPPNDQEKPEAASKEDWAEESGQVVEEQLVAPSKLSGKKNLVEVLASRLNLTEKATASASRSPVANSPPAPRASSASGRSVFSSSSNSSLSSHGKSNLTESTATSDSVKPSHRFIAPESVSAAASAAFKKNQDIFNKLDELNKKKLAKLSRESSISSFAEEKATTEKQPTAAVAAANEITKNAVAKLIRDLSAGSNPGLNSSDNSSHFRRSQRWTSAHFNSLYGLDSDDEKDHLGANDNNLASIANEVKRQRRCNSTNSALECVESSSKPRSLSMSSASSECSLPLPTPPPLLELQDEFQFGSSSLKRQSEEIYSTPTLPPPEAAEKSQYPKAPEQPAHEAILTPPPSTKIDIKESVRRYTNNIIEKNRHLGSDQQQPVIDSSHEVKEAPSTVQTSTPLAKAASKTASNKVQMLVNFIYNNSAAGVNNSTGQRASPEVAVEVANKPNTALNPLLRSLSSHHEPPVETTKQPRLTTHHCPSQLIQERLNDLVSNHGKHEARNDASPIRAASSDHQNGFVRASSHIGPRAVGRYQDERQATLTFPSPSRSTLEPQKASNESGGFKLDHLININPKRLNKNSKFRCRIHDLINEHGQFWIEVVYSAPDERKFTELFKLLRVCSNISQPPKDVHIGKRVSAWYKNEWHRAIILEIMEPAEQINSTVKVRFIDMGITKTLKRYQDIREVDDKFFQSPLKSLYCTIDLMGDMKLNREARKHFTRLIYKKMLYVKLVDTKTTGYNITSGARAYSPGYSYYSTSRDYLNDSNATTTLASIPPPPPYKVILGCPTQHGVINVYMYLLSKFNRSTYEHLKQQQLEGQERRPATSSGAHQNRWSQSNKSCQSLLPPMPSLASSSPQSARHSFPPPPPTLHHFVGSTGNLLPPPSPPRNPPPSPPSCAPDLPPRPSPISVGANLFGAATALNSNLYRPIPVNLSKVFGWMNLDADCRTEQEETLNGGEAFSEIYDKINSVSQVNHQTNNPNSRGRPLFSTATSAYDDMLNQETEHEDNLDEFYESRQADDAMFYDFDDTTTSDSDYLFSDVLNLTENSRMTATQSDAGLFSSKNDPLSSRTGNHDNQEEDYYAELDLKKLGNMFAPINSIQSSLNMPNMVTQKSYASPDPYNSIYFSANSGRNESVIDDGLDMTPVKEDENQSYRPNSTTLNNTTFNRGVANNSTFVSNERRRGTPLNQQDSSKLLANASILLPPSINLSPFQLRKYMECKQAPNEDPNEAQLKNNTSYNSDTDTSSQHAPCCPIPKFKKPIVAGSNRLKLLHNYKFEDRSYESYTQRQSMQSIKETSQPTELNKKVKFHLN